MDISSLDARCRQLLHGLDLGGLGLEIGPSHNPVAPRALGFNVEVLDHLDQQGLRDKYAPHQGIDLSRIEVVDHVSRGEPYHVLAGAGRFDWIVASHVIEHMPDMIGFLVDCATTMKPGGVLSLAVPDRRYCFDRFRPVSGIGDVVDAHLHGHKTPTAGDVVEHVLFASSRDGRIGWDPAFAGEAQWVHDAAMARSLLEGMRETPAHHDVHVWVQTPSSLRLLIEDLHALGLSPLREKAFAEGGHEFFLQLSVDGAGPALSRIELAQRALEEAGSPPVAPTPPKPAGLFMRTRT